jgi:hypothetical protein
MKKIAVTASLMILLSAFYACVAPTQKGAQTTNNPGVLAFTQATTFPVGCNQMYEAQSNVIASSEITVSWNRDSLGSAASQIISVRPSADVTAGGIYFVFCNLSPSPITVPAGAEAMYQVFN